MSTPKRNGQIEGDGKKQNLFECISKALRRRSQWSDKDELLDVLYWGRQLLSLCIGICWGLVPMKVSRETCNTQFSALEKDAFSAISEMAPFVTTIAISELLSRTSELIFLNIVTLENESFCVELTQRGWRVCSDRLDCMNGDFHKLDMHVVYYESINQLLDSLSQQYRDRFSAALASKLSALQTEQQQRQQQQNGEEKHSLG
uniref:DUF727 domain-containing protein n=1 Tax=Globodera pallida TaxID=36090 RepID=A0A183BS59_GLOPA